MYLYCRSTAHDIHDRFIASENTTMDQAYFDAIIFDKELGGAQGIDAALKMFDLGALLMPSSVAPGPAAIVGYPIITGPCLLSTLHCQTVF